MRLEDRKNLYREMFPLFGLGNRMAEQCTLNDYVIDDKTPKSFLITVFKSWDATEEGHEFWKGVRSLYTGKTPTRSQLLDYLMNNKLNRGIGQFEPIRLGNTSPFLRIR